jgi:alkylation response protein AidB-like acyl-CoA dehydrogenase
MNAPEPLALASRLLSRRDVDFLLHELLRVDTLTAHPRFAEHSRETFAAALDLAERLATDEFAPHNRKADLNEPHFDGQQVHMIPEVKAALDAFRETGLIAAAFDTPLGGMQLPYTVAQACFAWFNAANVATAGYPFLTTANANLLAAFGSAEQKAKYLPHLLSGRFFGTMCLSEPQAGSSLSDIRTRAERQPDGTWRLYGNKMWISGGDHELSENIVHLVLARAKGAPPGVKGISLFLCPRWLVNDDGSLGARNDVRLAGLNHKMGFRGTVNCVLNFGERDGAVAELVGEESRGLACMFHMMNEARIGVGLGAVALGYTGYLHALDYARHRPQGRHAQGKDPTSPQVKIVEHADVRRMLLAQKAYVEGGLALCLYCALLVDERKVTTDDARRRELGLLLDLLTPIAKAWPSQWCLAANDLAIQVHGGYGYTRDYAVEQFYRDNRLNPIHEGTNGIQALDLLGRKVTLEGGAALKVIGREMMATVAAARATTSADLHAWSDALATAANDLGETTRFLHSIDDLDLTLANAHVYLEAAGHIVVAWLWLKQAIVAHAALAMGASAGDQAFYRGKLQAARYFFGCELPKTGPQHALLRRLDATTLEMRDEWF